MRGLQALSVVVGLLGVWIGQGAHAALQVTCGSVIKLQHWQTGHLLHSHDIAYGSGSGQQSVTGFQGGDDSNSYWVVRGTEAEPCVQGTPMKYGTHLRLQHSNTRRWLHSHHFTSPLTGNQEVSAYGDDDTSDTGDHWTVVSHTKGSKYWERDASIEIRHDDTSVLLSSSARKYGRPIAGHQEICGKGSADKGTWWRATEGVYFPPREDA
mmetsp:Transcript_12188/g.36579  ORF Transcript_12188/g.36579 Transcript_12188/m.36579 type:complete len:210 (+) Transcript_12188:186-815(+)|eukprot:CAMPEP_0206138508 /NCGR_PEP_ID=MMETSP1473-20131121/3373_1 /ASSEMBLY_ACC=CAM_ASM_001109 /TAXON_ID=1461547 /ORGANISM="Stichococcus sp, Strain RCC1054" /LENGTH=209 /DNA_ID=CAMNT_0053531965 /DNA_START=127 /DNA_END=756 /DNA_ORIENTATION=-